MIDLKLPNWLSIPFFVKLKAAFQLWWAVVESWIQWPLMQMDVLTCHELLLDVVAYRRHIRRLENESTSMYRLRIATAYINATQAGTISGLLNIFERLSIPVVDIKQKLPNQHWAVIEVTVTQDVASEHGAILQELLGAYGKLCRNYRLTVVSPVSMYVNAVGFQYSSNTIISK